MIHKFKHHRMAQGKLGATDKYPFTVTQTLLLHTQTDKLWGTLILGMHTSCCTITHTLNVLAVFHFRGCFLCKSAFQEQIRKRLTGPCYFKSLFTCSLCRPPNLEKNKPPYRFCATSSSLVSDSASE